MSDTNSTAPKGLSRRGLLMGTAGLVGAGLVAARAKAQETGASAIPSGGNYVLKGGMIATMDPVLGNLRAGDIHVQDGRIVAVAASLDVPGAEVIDCSTMLIMPGMVETHWHMWNSLFKNMIIPGRGYVDLKRGLGHHHQPEDFYNAVRLCMAEAIDAGITTVMNYAHNTLSGAHVDAEIRAMVESGLRGRYAYGGADPTPSEQTMDLQDALRANREWFGGGNEWDGRVDYGFSVRAPGGLPLVWREELGVARDNNLPVILHGGQSPAAKVDVVEMDREGWVNERMIFVHSLLFTAEDRAVLARTGASNSISLGNEFAHIHRTREADVVQQMVLQMNEGVNVCLSFDATSLNRVSMFEQMRLCYATLIGEAESPTAGFERATPTQCLEMATINGARAFGFAGHSGSITPGKQADIILIRGNDLGMAPVADLHSTLVHSPDNRNVDTVIVDGKFLKRGGRLLSVDAEDVRARAVESLYNVRMRAGGDFAPDEGGLPRM